MKTSKKQRMYAAIQKHGEQLNAIFHTPFEPIELCKKLRRIELAQHRAATQWCNGDINENHYGMLTSRTKAQLKKILGDSIPIMLNGDPRGYALKLSTEIMEAKSLVLHKDWGGYGILAPDFSES